MNSWPANVSIFLYLSPFGLLVPVLDIALYGAGEQDRLLRT